MRVVHMGLWKVKADADPEMLRRAAEKVERFKDTVAGCTQSLIAPLYVPAMGAGDLQTFGNNAGFAEMARGYSYILYTVFESQAARDGYENHPAHMDLQEECLALWIGDASESVLVFDFLVPR